MASIPLSACVAVGGDVAGAAFLTSKRRRVKCREVCRSLLGADDQATRRRVRFTGTSEASGATGMT